MKKAILLPIILILSIIQDLSAQANITVYKSMFVYNFIKYLQWPEQSPEVRVAVIGDDVETFSAFEKMAKAKSTPGQQIVIQKFDNKNIGDLHVIYFDSKASPQALNVVLAVCKNKPIVLICENEAWIEKDIAIAFKVIDNKLKFFVNKEAFDKNGVKVSNALLSMSM